MSFIGSRNRYFKSEYFWVERRMNGGCQPITCHLRVHRKWRQSASCPSPAPTHRPTNVNTTHVRPWARIARKDRATLLRCATRLKTVWSSRKFAGWRLRLVTGVPTAGGCRDGVRPPARGSSSLYHPSAGGCVSRCLCLQKPRFTSSACFRPSDWCANRRAHIQSGAIKEPIYRNWPRRLLAADHPHADVMPFRHPFHTA